MAKWMVMEKEIHDGVPFVGGPFVENGTQHYWTDFEQARRFDSREEAEVCGRLFLEGRTQWGWGEMVVLEEPDARQKWVEERLLPKLDGTRALEW